MRRWEFDFMTMQVVKIFDRFAFPLTLDLKPFIDDLGRNAGGDDSSDGDGEG